MTQPHPMAPERWQKVQELFEQAIAVASTDRETWLAERCGGDAQLRAEVAALLASDATASPGFEDAVDQAIAGSLLNLDTVTTGTLIGRYRVLQPLGRGGMGAVYLAERADQQFDQRVALKLIGRNLPGSTLARRFRAERQILAQLNHPNIAHLLDGGTTEDGVPYLAMEYIEGTRIDVYCEQHALDIVQRLRLFQRVCAAVQYAHQHLVIHRDIKPSNILIAADGTPKLLDFGIAKLLASHDTGAATDVTRLHERVLTPEHASPEQMRGEPIGTTCDVYSLGVLLYQLLSGRAPYTLQGRTLQELEEIVCKVQPPRPSAVVSKALRRTLAGDLDNIVMRAMHKEPQRRYAAAAELAADIDNYLEHRPVQARPDDLGYRIGKFIRRNPSAIAAAGIGSVVLIALVTAFTLRLAAERDVAKREAEKATQVAHFLTEIFRVADPATAQGRQITAIEILDQGARDIKTRLAKQPLVRADLLAAIGLSFKNLSEFERAAPLLEESLAIRSAAGRELTQEFGQTLYELANLRRFQGRFAEAEAQFKRALQLQQTMFEGPHEDTAASLTHLGTLYYEMHRPEDSNRLQEQALSMTRALFGDNHHQTADCMNNLALVLQELDRHPEAERHLREAMRIRDSLLGVRHPSALTTRNNVALLLVTTGRYREAEAIYRELVPVRKAVMGATHPSAGLSALGYGAALTGLGKFREAGDLLQEAHGILLAKYGEMHWRVAATLSRQGALEMARGNYPRAQQLFEKSLLVTDSIYGADSVNAYRARTFLATALAAQGDDARATPLLEASYQALRTRIGTDTLRIQETLHALAEARLRAGRLDEAASLLRTEIANFERVAGALHPDAAVARLELARIAMAQQRTPDAMSLANRGLSDLASALPPDHWKVALAEVTLGRALLSSPRAGESAALILRGSKSLQAQLPDADPRVTYARGASQLLAAQ